MFRNFSPVESCRTWVYNPLSYLLDKLNGLICTIFLIISCIFPWRFVEVIALSEKVDKSKPGFRYFALNSIALTLFDFVAVPCGILSALSPRIWIHLFVWYIYLKKLDNKWDITQKSIWRTRYEFIYAFVGALRDLASFPFLLLALLTPSRTYIVYSETLLTINRFIDYQGTLSASGTSLSLLEHWCDLEDWLELWNECNVLWFEQRMGGRGWIFWITRSVFAPTPYPRAMPH